MSILKESMQASMSSKAFKWLLLLIVLFLTVFIYFFSYVITYKEDATSSILVNLQIMALKTNTDSHRVFYKIEGNDTLYFVDIKKCNLKPRLAGSTIKAEKTYYSYSATFRTGRSSRLESPENLFCSKV